MSWSGLCHLISFGAMTSTRVTTLVVFLIGSTGLATLSIADSMALAVAGGASVMAAAIYLVRHFWRESAKKRDQKSALEIRESTRALSELRQTSQQLESSMRSELQRVTVRVDAFARGVLEYLAQIQLDLEKTHLDLAKGHADLTSKILDLERIRADITSTHSDLAKGHTDLTSKVLDLERIRADITSTDSDLAKGHTDLASKLQDLEKAVERAERAEDHMTSQVMGVVGLYATLKPDLPYPPFGGWAVSGDCARRLVEAVMTVRPSAVIEVGSGLSTLLIAQALERVGGDGRVVALEHEKLWMDKSRALLALHGMAHRADVVHAPLAEVYLGDETFKWYDLSDVNLPDEAEIIFVDGPPKATGPLARYPALPLLIDRLVLGGVILMDDANRPDERTAIRRWQEEIPELEIILHSDDKGTVELRRGTE